MFNGIRQRVLVVDDHTEFRRSLRKILQKAGYRVSTASTGQQATTLFSETFYPVILLDVHLPGESGLELLKELRSKSPASRVIIVTVNGEAPIHSEAIKLGAFAFLNKPVKKKAILDSMNLALEQNSEEATYGQANI